eukprot:TRINITY_DN4451_c0_g1_i2.p1 TRINITY_DN4451_c0_g1~~TRINITY_DN4451_c0_g1_i2.p1  ORF type:complete len:119 (+),score=2.59 TRINITY_DN4451_c0_g1_i2:140-496(+)
MRPVEGKVVARKLESARGAVDGARPRADLQPARGVHRVAPHVPYEAVQAEHACADGAAVHADSDVEGLFFQLAHLPYDLDDEQRERDNVGSVIRVAPRYSRHRQVGVPNGLHFGHALP